MDRSLFLDLENCAIALFSAVSMSFNDRDGSSSHD